MPTPLQPPGPNDEQGYVAEIGIKLQPSEARSLAYQVISSTSLIESWRQDLFVELLGGEGSIGSAAYLALNTRGPKIAAITAAAKAALPSAAFGIFSEMLKATDCLERYRDRLAHWKEYSVARVKDGLALQDPSVKPVFDKAPAHGIYVFTTDEMKRYINYAVHLANLHFLFLQYLKENAVWSQTEYDKLNQKLEALAMERQRL